MVLLFSQSYKLLLVYISKSKFARYSKYFSVLLFVLFLFTSVIPSLTSAYTTLHESVTKEEIQALVWIKENTPSDAVVLAPVGDGHLINAVANRKNVIDSNFLFVKDSDERFEDISTIFKTAFKTETILLLNKYQVSYLYVSREAIFNPSFQLLKFRNEKCFNLVFDDIVKVYEITCKVEVVS